MYFRKATSLRCGDLIASLNSVASSGLSSRLTSSPKGLAAGDAWLTEFSEGLDTKSSVPERLGVGPPPYQVDSEESENCRVSKRLMSIFGTKS